MRWLIVGSDDFYGNWQLSLDDKGRLTVPARFREPLKTLCEGKVFITKHQDRCLQILPEPRWREFLVQLKDPSVSNQWRRFFMGSMVEVQLDGGGRLSISQALRDFAGLDKDVMLIGLESKFELWDASRHAAKEDQLLEGEAPGAIANF